MNRGSVRQNRGLPHMQAGGVLYDVLRRGELAARRLDLWVLFFAGRFLGTLGECSREKLRAERNLP